MVNKFLYPRAGAETYMLELSRLLKDHGHQVAFFGMNHPEKTKLGLTSTVSPIDFSKSNGVVKNISELGKAFLQNLKIRAQFQRFCQSFKPDLIHAHNVYNQISPDLFKSINVPVVMTAHDYKPVCPSYNLFSNGENCEKCLVGSFTPCVTNKCVQGSMIKSLISAMSSWYHKKEDTYNKLYTKIVSPSHFMKRKLIQGGLNEDKIEVVHNFTKAKKSIFPNKGFLLYAGRICQEKGVKNLIDAYEALPTPRPQLKICGTGPLKPELQKHTESKGLDIEWLGYVKPTRVKALISECRAVVVPSIWYENCSMTIMESLVLGKPVIASITGGNPELINDGVNGFTFEAGNTSQLLNALQKLLSADQGELERNAYSHGQSYFGPDAHYKSIMKIYKSVADLKFSKDLNNCKKAS